MTAIAFRSTVGLGGRTATGIRVPADVLERLDTAPRTVTVPPDLAAALAASPDARALLDGLSYSRRQRYVLQVDGAKTAKTRRRRIDKVVGMLREQRLP